MKKYFPDLNLYFLTSLKMSSLELPFSQQDIENAISAYWDTPFFLYDEKRMQESSQNLKKAFHNAGFEDFKNHFAVKANPNRHVLQILANSGMGMDCSSVSELHSAQAVGVTGEDIMFTSNNTTAEQFAEAKEVGAIINLDDISHIEALEYVGLPDIVSCRWNPGNKIAGNGLIWIPNDVKYGMTTWQIVQAFHAVKRKWVKRFGLHTMVVTDERRVPALVETARLLFELAVYIKDTTWVMVEFINLWGGISVPYTPEQEEVDLNTFTRWVRTVYDQNFSKSNGWEPQIRMENGRYLTGNAGVYVTKVINVADKYHRFVWVDGGMQDFPRPGRVKAYHHLSVIGDTRDRPIMQQVIHGSLCIWSDVFTPTLKAWAAPGRDMVELQKWDLIVLHTAGAHGHATGYNYNWQPRCGEVLKNAHDGMMRVIRRKQREEELHWGVPPLINI